MKETLAEVPDINFAFDKGKVMYYYQKPNEKPVRREEKLSQVDKTIESTAARISDESLKRKKESNPQMLISMLMAVLLAMQAVWEY